MTKALRWGLIGSFLALPGVAGAQASRETLVVFDPIGRGLESRIKVDEMAEGEQRERAILTLEETAAMAVGDLMRDEFKKLGYDVLARSATEEQPCAEESCAAKIGRTLGASQAVITRLSRLGSKVIMVSTLVETATGNTLFSDRTTAASLDDLDVLSVRMARALAKRITMAGTITADTVSDQEARNPNRRKAAFTTGLRLHGFIPISGYAGATHLYGGEWINYYEVGAWQMEAALGLRANSDDPDVSAVETFVDLGAYYFLSDEDISPFVGGGVGLHSLVVDWDRQNEFSEDTRDSASGPSLWVGGGLMLFRTADVHLVGLAKYQVMPGGSIDGQVPNGFLIGVAITYAKRGGTCCLW